MDPEIESKHTYKITELHPTPVEVKKGFQDGVSAGWNSLRGEPTTFNIIFANLIISEKTKEDSGETAEYDQHTDRFLFSLSTFKKAWQAADVSDGELAFLIGAHEGSHKAQLARDGSLSISGQLAEEEYLNDQQEQEAWRIALKAYNQRNPDQPIEQIILEGGKKTYTAE